MTTIAARTAIARPPGPHNPPLLGQLPAYRRDGLGFLLRLASDYGEIVYFKIGPRDVYLLDQPESIKDVLVTYERVFPKGLGTDLLQPLLGQGLLTSSGEAHLRQHRLLQPAFHRARVAAYGEAMVEEASAAAARWRDGVTLDLHGAMMRLTLAVVARTLFSTDVTAEAPLVAETLDAFLRWWRVLMLPYSPLLQPLPLPIKRRFARTRARLDAFIARLIATRRADGADRSDLLSMLLLARDEDGQGMSDAQVRDEAVTLLLAGHETTANALTWTWYLLAQHPAIMARLHAELDDVLAGRPPTVADVPRLRYTEMVLSEALRLFPPVWGTSRRAAGDCELGGYPIPRGAVVVVSQWVTHHNPRYYPDPFQFDPERWAPEARARRPRYAYFPFGGGARMCIGESFAWLEGMLLLATLAQHWRMALVPGHPVVPLALVTLRPKYGVRMTIERRR
jgi:cytochrome P450